MQSNQDKSPIVDTMQKQGMSTTDIVKSLAAPLIESLNLPKDAKGAEKWIIGTDMVAAQTTYKIQNNIEKSDAMMVKIGEIGEILAGFVEKKPKAYAAIEERVKDYNNLVTATNGNSNDNSQLLGEVKKLLQNVNIVQSDLVTLSSGGKISGEEFASKMRDQFEKMKQVAMTDPKSLMNQSDALTDKQINTEAPVQRLQDNIMTVLNQTRTTLESLKSKAPEAPAAAENEAPSHGGGLGAGGRRGR